MFIGPPSVRARYDILSSSLRELVRVGIISPACEIPPFGSGDTSNGPAAKKLATVAEKCDGLSGRALRKIPLLAHACFIQRSSCTLEDFVAALSSAVDRESVVRKELESL